MRNTFWGLFHSISLTTDSSVLIPPVINLQVDDNPLPPLIDMSLVHFFYQKKQSVQVRHFNGSGHSAYFIGVTGFFDDLNSSFDKPA